MVTTEVPYWEKRIESVISHMAEPGYRARHFTFYTNEDQESLRRSYLPHLNQYSDDIRYDPEGYVYVASWRQTNKIPRGARIFGPTQSWRDYAENPPITKIYMRHSWDQVKGGVDIALRRSIEVRDHYRREGTETAVVMATFQRLGELRGELASFGQLSDEDLSRIVEENGEFLEGTPTFTRPRLRGKERVARNLRAGFLDKNGHRNYGAAMMRLFAVELELRKRWEGSFPPILGKQASIVEVLEFEREYARQNLIWNQERLDEVAALEPQDAENQTSFVRRYEQDLIRISINLTHNVVVRPYSLGARKVAEILGATRFQAQRQESTVLKHVRDGELDQARALLGKSKEALQQVLDANENYMQVKKGLKVRSKARKPIKKPEDDVPFIFR